MEVLPVKKYTNSLLMYRNAVTWISNFIKGIDFFLQSKRRREHSTKKGLYKRKEWSLSATMRNLNMNATIKDVIVVTNEAIMKEMSLFDD